MSAMARDFYEASPFLLLPLVALALFGGAFIAICWRTIRLGSEGADAQSRIALNDGESVHE